MRLIISNAHIISPDVDISAGSVEVEAGKIKAVYEAGATLPKAGTCFCWSIGFIIRLWHYVHPCLCQAFALLCSLIRLKRKKQFELWAIVR